VARRGRRMLTWFVVLVLVLGVLLLAADRIGAYAAERTIAEKVSQQTTQLDISSSEPEVTVGGFPFVTQVLDGTYKDIRIVLRDVSKGGVVLPELDVHAQDVEASMSTLMSGEGEVVAKRMVGTATIGYSSVRALFDRPGLELSEQDGRLRLRLPLTIEGQQFTAVAVGEVSGSAGQVRLAITDIGAEGITLIPQAQRLLDDYKQQLSLTITLPPLPFRLRVESVQVRPEGLAITASARSVPLSG